jgi:hypothetical protein
MMKNHARWLAAVAGSTLVLAGSSQAELVDRGATTLDTETGLEWLDVSATLDVSAYDILVGGYGGLVADGWTLATVEEIDALFLHAGIPLPHDGSQTPAGFAGADRLIALLGASGSSGSGLFIQAFSGTLVAPAPPFYRHTPVVITAFGSIGGADLLGAIVPSSVRSPTIGNYLVRPAGPSTIEVSIDIKPGSLRNPIHPHSKGVIPVAVLTTGNFDVHCIDLSSVRFGPAGAAPMHEKGHYLDVDGDGDLDLLLLFRTQATGISCKETMASLTGATLDGAPFEGQDDIVTVGCGR